MGIASLGSKWILGCTTVGLFALAATYAVAAPKDPEARAVTREARAEVVGRSILRLPMVDDLGTASDAFVPPGQAIARENRAARDSRAAARGADRADVDLAATVHSGGSDDAPSVTPIPEPSSLILLAAGAGLVAYAARRKLA